MHTKSLPPTDRDETSPTEPITADRPVTLPKGDMVSTIPGDAVYHATKDLPDNQRSAIRWLHAFSVENSLSNGEVGKLIRMSDSTVSLVLRGKYTGSLENVTKSIETFRELNERRSQGKKLPFIPTILSRRIWAICDAAVEFQRMAFMFGNMQIGKSTSLEEYQASHNHGNTIYLPVPTGGHLSHFCVRLAEILKISTQIKISELRRRIIDSFDDRMLLIVDEAHQCIPQSGFSTERIQTIEFIREIFNEKKCGVVICATNVFRDAMDTGHLSKILHQTKRRRLCTLQLPDVPTAADLNTFAAAYDLKPATGDAATLQKNMVEDEALGMWLTLLRMAAKIAAIDQKAMSWDYVLRAYSGLKELEGAK